MFILKWNSVHKELQSVKHVLYVGLVIFNFFIVLTNLMHCIQQYLHIFSISCSPNMKHYISSGTSEILTIINFAEMMPFSASC